MTHLIAKHGRDWCLDWFRLPAGGQIGDGCLVVFLVVGDELLPFDCSVVTLHGPGCDYGGTEFCTLNASATTNWDNFICEHSLYTRYTTATTRKDNAQHPTEKQRSTATRTTETFFCWLRAVKLHWMKIAGARWVNHRLSSQALLFKANRKKNVGTMTL